ncbi:MAG: helix-turn-helix domain-containing protein [Candidatus Thiodiazotropha sp. (ex Semelilucina semeliformis)]|nr:helix-turn-helix domain-containing protein [Candidatus Thiodiazotropha sp. (ex Semelilucina semeliformis)]
MGNIKKVFGETLRKHRTAGKRTQQDIAMTCEMSLRFYQDLEAGSKQPTITTLFRLADSLEVKPAKLIEAAYKEWQKDSD